MIATGAGRDVQGLDLAGHSDGLFGGDPERIDQATDLAPAVTDRLSGFDAQRIGQFVEPLGEAVDAMLQHGLAFVRRHPRHRLGGLNGGGNASVDDLGIGESNAGGHLAGVFVRDLKIEVRGLRLIRQIERIGVLQYGHVACSPSTA